MKTDILHVPYCMCCLLGVHTANAQANQSLSNLTSPTASQC